MQQPGNGGTREAVIEEEFGGKREAGVVGEKDGGVAAETSDDEFVGDEEGSEELVGGDDVAVEGAGEEGGGSGGDADDVGGGGAFGAEELEFGEDEVVGVAEEDGVLALDDLADLERREAVGGQEGENGVGPVGAVEAELAGDAEGSLWGEAEAGDEVGDCEGVRNGAAEFDKRMMLMLRSWCRGLQMEKGSVTVLVPIQHACVARGRMGVAPQN